MRPIFLRQNPWFDYPVLETLNGGIHPYQYQVLAPAEMDTIRRSSPLWHPEAYEEQPSVTHVLLRAVYIETALLASTASCPVESGRPVSLKPTTSLNRACLVQP